MIWGEGRQAVHELQSQPRAIEGGAERKSGLDVARLVSGPECPAARGKPCLFKDPGRAVVAVQANMAFDRGIGTCEGCVKLIYVARPVLADRTREICGQSGGARVV